MFIWGWVKTLVPSEPQNSWDLWMFIPLKMVLIGIDPYPYFFAWGKAVVLSIRQFMGVFLQTIHANNIEDMGTAHN